MTIQSRAERLKDLADDTEKQCAEWIKHNPHVALIYALAAHEAHWYGCKCDLDNLVVKALPIQTELTPYGN